jgi:Fe-S-cluster containining protein
MISHYDGQMPEIQFEIKVRARKIGAKIALPDEPINPVDLLPILQGFTDAIVDAAAADSLPISCRAGCGACCRQLVPISETEAFYLARVIEEMEPTRKGEILARFDGVLRALESAGILDCLRAPTDDPELAPLQLGLEYFNLGIACPFLENESCGIYAHRPLGCREYLVTTPAEGCSSPLPGNVRPVPMPTRTSYVLCRFGDGIGDASPKVIALPLLLEVAARNRLEDQVTLPAAELFENFFRKVTGNITAQKP